MPQRQSIIMYDSTEVQGEGSWIKVRMITHGQGKNFQRQFADVVGTEGKDISAERRAEFSAASDGLIVSQVFDWNWVNDEGEPLPLPKDDPSVVDYLTEFEHKFIASAMQGEGERKK